MSIRFLQVPVDNAWVSQIHGVNKQNYEKYGLAGHNGIDFACPEGTPVYLRIEGVTDDGTAANGIATCVFAGNMGELGNTVIVHVNDTRIWKGGYLLLFSHLLSVQCVTGIGVANGWTIGLSGNTGRSTGPHLHFGLSPCDRMPNFKNIPPNWRSAQLNRDDGYLGWVDSLGYFAEMPKIMPGASADFVIDNKPIVQHQTLPTVSEKVEVIPTPLSVVEQTAKPLTETVKQKAQPVVSGIKYEGNRLVRRGLVVVTTLMIAWQTGAVNPDQIVGLLSSALVPLITNQTTNVEAQLSDSLLGIEQRLLQIEEDKLAAEAQPVFAQPVEQVPEPTPVPTPLPPVAIIPDSIQCYDVAVAGGWHLRTGPDTSYPSVRVTLYPQEVLCVSYPATPNGWFQIQEGIERGNYISPEAFERG